ncbi:MAG: endonuclease, partial [Comamonadaceae bacterium]
SLVILREQAAAFAGKTIARVEGNTSIGKARLIGQRIVALRTWGKHFLIEMPEFSLRVHFLLFGSYRINERKEGQPRLSLQFDGGDELNFYTCSVKYIEEPLDEVYDWHADVMSDAWKPALALKRLRAAPDTLACDALLDQDVFAGVGNIIKNEVLYRIHLHPLSTVGGLPAAKLRELVGQARQYSFDFLEWKKAFVLKQHWLAHRKSQCLRCDLPLTKAALGKTQRKSYFCSSCQALYGHADDVPAAPAKRKTAKISKTSKVVQPTTEPKAPKVARVAKLAKAANSARKAPTPGG